MPKTKKRKRTGRDNSMAFVQQAVARARDNSVHARMKKIMDDFAITDDFGIDE